VPAPEVALGQVQLTKYHHRHFSGRLFSRQQFSRAAHSGEVCDVLPAVLSLGAAKPRER
jgi:hypothetical protein